MLMGEHENIIDGLFYCTIGNVPYMRSGGCHVYQRLHMHRFVCDLDSVWDQADGEPQRVAGAARGACGDFVFQIVLQGRVRTVHRVGVGESAAGGFREAARMARGEGLARQGRRRVRLQGAGAHGARIVG